MFKIRNEFDEEFENAEKRRREESQHMYDSSPSMTPLPAQKPVKKKILNLGKYLEPFSMYNISDTYELRYILHIYKTIECDVYQYNLDKKTFQKNTYRDLCVEFNYSSGQNEVYDMFGVTKRTLSFTLNGQNIKNGISDDSEEIINNLWEKHMYVETDNFGNYKKIVIFKHNAPEYDDYEDKYNDIQQSIIYKETKLFNNVIAKKNHQNTPSEYKYYVDKLVELFQNLPECSGTSSIRNSTSDDMDYDNDEVYGGYDSFNQRLHKYRAYLKRQNIQKLQNIAKNKSIKFERKYKGKMVSIKPETLIENLSKHFCRMKI
jgi:hypothetical protein